MWINNNNKAVESAIRRGLHTFFLLAELKLRSGTDFKNMSRAQQLEVGRALFTLRDIAAEPDKYFSREATEGAWTLRIEDYAKTYDVNPVEGYCFAESPADIVRDTVAVAFWGDYKLRSKFNSFCEYIEYWHYDSTSMLADRYEAAPLEGKKIIAAAKRINNEYGIEKDGRTLHYVNKFLDNLRFKQLSKIVQRG